MSEFLAGPVLLEAVLLEAVLLGEGLLEEVRWPADLLVDEPVPADLVPDALLATGRGRPVDVLRRCFSVISGSPHR